MIGVRGAIVQTFVPVPFQVTRNQAILRLNSAETASGQLGLLVRTLEAVLPLPVSLLSASFDLIEGSYGHFSSRETVREPNDEVRIGTKAAANDLDLLTPEWLIGMGDRHPIRRRWG